MESRVCCIFNLPEVSDRPIEIHGDVVLVLQQELKRRTIFYYGIRFVDAERPLIDPLVSYVEQLVKDGKLTAH